MAHPLDWYPSPDDDPRGVEIDAAEGPQDAQALRAMATRMEQAPWHPSVELAVSLARAAALALDRAHDQPAQVTDIRKGLLAIERLFELRGAKLIEANHLVAQRIRTEWEIGRMLAEARHEGRLRAGRPPEIGSRSPYLSLAEIGVAPWDSKKFQRLAQIDRDDLEHWIENDINDRELSTAAALAQWKTFIRDAERQRVRSEAAAKPAPAYGEIPETVRIEVADARSLPLDDATVDLIVTSPPYALDVAYEDGDVSAEDWPVFMHDWLLEAYRVAKPSGRLALNIPLDTSKPVPRPTYAEAVAAAVDAGWSYQATITWDEGNTTKGNRALGSVDSAARPIPVDSSEMIALFSKGPWGPSSDNPDDIFEPGEWQEYGRGPWKFSGESRPYDGHPAPFPEQLPYRLIRYLCRIGDLVMDPFSGSGSTAVVATRLGRQFVGFDLSEAYVRSALRRVVGR